KRRDFTSAPGVKPHCLTRRGFILKLNSINHKATGMVSEDIYPALFLRQSTERPGFEKRPGLDAKETEEKAPEEEKHILCRQCQQAVTSPAERITVQGSHEHTFANPHGLIFDIGCFKAAKGCGYAGPPTEEFSWFKGYSWKISVCGRCLTHLGWLFISRSGDSFHGLILDRLIQPN
ncbi:MAG: hypothetical protein JSW39_06715, partial [Desulfobacterales bacterium]